MPRPAVAVCSLAALVVVCGAAAARAAGTAAADPADGTAEVAGGGLPLLSARITRAQFGGALRCRAAPLAAAAPDVHGCAAHAPYRGGQVAVARRGRCTFSHKALLAQEAGAAGLLVVNDADDEAVAMPAEPAHAASVVIPVAMVGSAAGEAVLARLRQGGAPLSVRLTGDGEACAPPPVPPRLSAAGAGAFDGGAPAAVAVGSDGATRRADPGIATGAPPAGRQLAAAAGGELFVFTGARARGAWAELLSGGAAAGLSAEQLRQQAAHQAAFHCEYVGGQGEAGGGEAAGGPAVAVVGELTLEAAHPSDACGEPREGAPPPRLNGSSALLVARGGCSFAHKARIARAAGAALMVVVNSEPVGVSAVHHGSDAASIMVSSRAGRELRRLLDGRAEERGAAAAAAATVVVVVVALPSPDVEAAWREIGGLLADPAGAWPADTAVRRKLFLRLAKRHHPDKQEGDADRFAALRWAFAAANHHHAPQLFPAAPDAATGAL